MIIRRIVNHIALFISVLSPFSASTFTWGACGHQIWDDSIWEDPETQFATLEQRGLKTYRCDIPLVDDKPHAADSLQRLIDLATKYHITLHPVLYVPFTWGDNATDNGKYPATAAGLEAQGYNRVYPFVLKFAPQIQDWEIENEINLVQGMKKGIGRIADDYDTPKAHQWAAVLRGMSKAIRAVQKKTWKPLRTVVDTTYVDFGFIPFLENNGVSIDKLAYHYYYSLGTSPYKISAPDGQIVNIFMEMKKLGKPIIINELNAAEVYDPTDQGKPYDDGKALASLKSHIDYIVNQKIANIEGVEYYELYNEPEKDAAESNFGLMKDATHTRTQMLLAAVYACGKLSTEEQATLISSGLFTTSALADKLKSCGPH